jgi:hypothetical protein
VLASNRFCDGDFGLDAGDVHGIADTHIVDNRVHNTIWHCDGLHHRHKDGNAFFQSYDHWFM